MPRDSKRILSENREYTVTPFEKFSLAGSLASILGFFVSVYVLVKEHFIGEDVENLKKEEEQWHEEEHGKLDI